MNFRTAATLTASTLIASSLAFGVMSAGAADLPVKAPPLVAPLSWTGFYVGGNIGAMRGNSDYETVCPALAPTCPVLIPPFAFNGIIPGGGPGIIIVPALFSSLPGAGASGTSFMGGGQAGYNWQVNKWVFGVEGDVDAARIRTTVVRNAIPSPGGGFQAGCCGTVVGTSNFSSDWTASIRGRLGIASGAFLFYGTAGIAFADSSVTTGFVYTPPAIAIPALVQPGPTGARASQTLVGWTAGVGGEWMVNRKVSVGAEYRHSDFGSQSYLLGFDIAATPVYGNVKYTTDQVTLRANWHLN